VGKLDFNRADSQSQAFFPKKAEFNTDVRFVYGIIDKANQRPT
jgi:hypothetical protein